MFDKTVTYRHFKMDNLKVALTIARKNYSMVSIDLCDEYHMLLLPFSEQKHLIFQIEGQLYKFIYLYINWANISS